MMTNAYVGAIALVVMLFILVVIVKRNSSNYNKFSGKCRGKGVGDGARAEDYGNFYKGFKGSRKDLEDLCDNDVNCVGYGFDKLKNEKSQLYYKKCPTSTKVPDGLEEGKCDAPDLFKYTAGQTEFSKNQNKDRYSCYLKK